MKIFEARITFQFVCEESVVVTLGYPEWCVRYLADVIQDDPMHECFWVISLNRKNKPIGRTCISRGSATSCLAHPREVYRAAVLAGATAIVVAHNHPSGDPSPSRGDLAVTRLLRAAGIAIDIELMDHVIIGEKSEDPKGLGYFSFRSNNVL